MRLKFLIFFFTCALLSGISISWSRVWVVDQNSPESPGIDSGDKDSPFTTISAAASKAMPGDTVMVLSGIYRERIAPERGGEQGNPIVYMAAHGHKVVIKGSEIFEPDWKSDHPSLPVFLGKINSTLITALNPFAIPLKTRPGHVLGQLFLDGEPLLQVIKKADLERVPGTWMAVESGTALRMHLPYGYDDPGDGVMEITVRQRTFAPFKRGLGYIYINGFSFLHAANQFPASFWNSDSPQAGSVSCRGGHHWVIENNVIQHAKCVGLDCGSEGEYDADGLDQPQPENSGYHIIRNNVIIDNGSAGIVGIRSPETQILGNRIERNNRLGFSAPECGGIKLHFFTQGRIEGNLLRDNDASGIWLDNVYKDSRITRNVIIGNSGAGIFIELGNGPLLVDNNVVAFTTANTSLAGDGVYSHDAGRVTLVHNLIYFNANFGVWSHIATDRGQRRGIEQSGWRIMNNMILGNHRGALSLPAPFERAKDTMSDYNLITSGFDLLTSETYALELDEPFFLLNTSKGRVEIDSLAHSLQRFLAKNKAAPLNLSRWSAFPYLSLQEWQGFTGNDRNSRVPIVLRPLLAPHSLVLRFILGPGIEQLSCPRIGQVDKDLLGNPFTDHPYPGPFQNLKTEPMTLDRSEMLEFRGPFNGIKAENQNSVVLWPVTVFD